MNSKSKNVVRIKNLLPVILILSFLLFLTPSLHSQNLKIGIVNAEKIYASYTKAQDTEKTFQTERKIKQDELNKKEEELKKLKADYDSKLAKMRDSEKKEKEAEFNKKRDEILKYIQDTNTYLRNKNQSLVQERLKEISDVINNFAKENKYDLIIDKKYTPYFSSTLDISDTITEKLNSKK